MARVRWVSFLLIPVLLSGMLPFPAGCLERRNAGYPNLTSHERVFNQAAIDTLQKLRYSYCGSHYVDICG